MRQGFLQCTDRALEVVVETRRAFLALVRHADAALTTTTTGPNNNSNNNNNNITPTTSTSTLLPSGASVSPAVLAPRGYYVFDFEECALALSSCDASLGLLLALVAQQSTSLKSVVHEPVILSPPFPVAEHAALLDQFRQVQNTGQLILTTHPLLYYHLTARPVPNGVKHRPNHNE